jgi:hypothetical protein
MSITLWTRVEPLSRRADISGSLQAKIRDPLWLLAMQQVTGELTGEDSGSPVLATLTYSTRTLTGYRPIGGPAVGYDDTVPLEAHVEREAVSLGLRGSVQLGLFLENLLDSAQVADFRQAFPISQTAPPGEIEDAQAPAVRSLTAGRVTDGEIAYQSFIGTPGAPPLPPSASQQSAHDALVRLKAFREALFTIPRHDSAWDRPNLDYSFAVGSDGDAAAGSTELSASRFPGGRLDWYSFDATAAAIGGGPPTTPVTTTLSFVPTRTTFGGMAENRWWNFEDAKADYGSLVTEQVDLARLLVMEFALLYSGDWFQFPVQLELGTLTKVTQLQVTDTFGQVTQIPAAASLQPPGTRPWRMFALSGDGSADGVLYMAPTLARWQDGAPLEEVAFLRDDLAATAWAVEQTLQGPLDAPVDGQESFLRRLNTQPPPPPPAPVPDGPDAWYLLGTTVPDNWIPMVRVTASDRSQMLRRGKMTRAVQGGPPVQVAARGQILEPSVSPYLIYDRSVPPAGAQLTRYVRRTRWLNGATCLWIGRRSSPGKGIGWSGLQFDLTAPMGQGPDLVHP